MHGSSTTTFCTASPKVWGKHVKIKQSKLLRNVLSDFFLLSHAELFNDISSTFHRPIKGRDCHRDAGTRQHSLLSWNGPTPSQHWPRRPTKSP